MRPSPLIPASRPSTPGFCRAKCCELGAECCSSLAWEPPKNWTGHEHNPEHALLFLLKHLASAKQASEIPGFRPQDEEGGRKVDRRQLKRLITQQANPDKAERLLRQGLPQRLMYTAQVQAKPGVAKKNLTGDSLALRSIWKADEFEENEKALLAADLRSRKALDADWSLAVRRLKELFSAAQAAAGGFQWVLDEGSLLASLRWGAMWRQTPRFGLELTDDDFDVLLFANSPAHWKSIASALAAHASGSGYFQGIELDPAAENFGWDVCGVLQMDYMGSILIDIKVILRDQPMLCMPCRIHPSAALSAVCRNSSMAVSHGLLHGETVPVQPLAEALLQLALHRYWKPDASNALAVGQVIIPRKSKGKKRNKKVHFSDLQMMRSVGTQLCEQGAVSFEPIFSEIDKGVAALLSAFASDSDRHEELE